MSQPMKHVDIKQLIAIMRELFQFHAKQRAEKPLARKIKLPQVPSALSESLALLMLRKGLILNELKKDGFNYRSGGTVADIIGVKGTLHKKIEVKSTGDKEFQRMSKKDSTCDYLLWLHFGDYFSKSIERPIKVYLVRNPSKHFIPFKEANLTATLNKLGDEMEETDVDLADLLNKPDIHLEKFFT
jgi:hypothetical protein